MSTKFDDTVFVIGAGAHAPYGFPTGEVLTEKIKQLHHEHQSNKDVVKPYLGEDDSQLELELQEYIELAIKMELFEEFDYGMGYASDRDFLEVSFLRFIESFGGSRVYSIDSFLSKYIKDNEGDDLFPLIGKFLIANLILDYEDENRINFLKTDWIDLIINNFLKDSSDVDFFFENPPVIITFNYDNLFERILKSHLMNYHNKTANEALSLVDKLSICHVYGDVGSSRKDNREDQVRYSMNSLKVIGEERSDSAEIQNTISNRFRNKKNLYFLGFGFDDQNMKLLGFDNISRFDSYNKIYSTAFNLSEFEKSSINKNTDYRITFGNNYDPKVNVDSFKLLNEIEPVFINEPQVNLGSVFTNEPEDYDEDYDDDY